MKVCSGSNQIAMLFNSTIGNKYAGYSLIFHIFCRESVLRAGYDSVVIPNIFRICAFSKAKVASLSCALVLMVMSALA